MRPEVLCRLLAEPDRLAVHAAVVLGATTPGEVARSTGLAPREVAAALRRLVDGGLVQSSGGTLAAGAAVFKRAVRSAAPSTSTGPPLDRDQSRAAVLRSFIRDGRLLRLPAAWGKRRVVLEHVAASFEPGVKYPEREVDAVLRAWHADHASLRRYLVDEELMARGSGVYWRIGGPV